MSDTRRVINSNSGGKVKVGRQARARTIVKSYGHPIEVAEDRGINILPQQAEFGGGPSKRTALVMLQCERWHRSVNTLFR